LNARRRRTLAERTSGRFGSLASFAVAFSLLVQLLFIPYHQASLVPGVPAPSDTEIAASLRAIFGDAAVLCTQGDDKSGQNAPTSHCGDDCPFCRFAAQAATLVPPDAPALPVRFEAAFVASGVYAAPASAPSASGSPHRARAPPVIV
jgi:hypothetical protein